MDFVRWVLTLRVLQKILLASLAILALGVILIALPFDISRTIVVAREQTSLYEGTWSEAGIDLEQGVYDIWIPDRNPTEQNFGSLDFEIESIDSPVDMQRHDGSVVREIDGTPHELYCSFIIEHDDMYFYSTSINGTELNGTSLELVFSRHESRVDQPTFSSGLVLVILGTVAIPVSMILLAEPSHQSFER
jgi:hypothetical protein